MAADALPITKRVQIINWKEFIKVALDPNREVFLVHVATITSQMAIHLTRQAQIALLQAEIASVTVPEEYSNYADVFSENLAMVLSEHTKINTHTINHEEDKQPPYGSIYGLGPLEIETLKTYIETNLANGFICSSKSPASTLILFNQKPDRSLRLCINYRGLNNLTIKNRYSLSLIGESLD